MSAEIDLLPLPEWMECLEEVDSADIRDYARANVARNTALLRAEIEALRTDNLRTEVEALRAEVAEWKRVAAAQAELHGEAEARADKLAEALRLAEEHINAITPEWYSAGQRVLAEIRAALEQENSND